MKRYLVRFSFNSEEEVKTMVSLVAPNAFGDAGLEVYAVADEAWVRQNMGENLDLRNMALNDKWVVQLKGDNEKV